MVYKSLISIALVLIAMMSVASASTEWNDTFINLDKIASSSKLSVSNGDAKIKTLDLNKDGYPDIVFSNY